MNAGRSIVIAVRDDTNGPIALRRALHTANSPLDRFHLVHVSRTASWQRMAELLTPAWMIPGGERDSDPCGWLRRLSESVDTAGRRVEFEVLEGEPGQAIVGFARQVGADLIVLATPREGEARELFLGSTALRVLRTAPCPVLVARNRTTAAYARALLAVDRDEAGRRVAHAATTWLSDAEIDLVHGFRVPQEGRLRMHGHTEEEIANLRRFMQADVEAQLESYRLAFPRAAFHFEQGFAATVILDAALRLRPDVLVLGKHRGSVVDERVIGSVAHFMLYNCPTDIMLVP
jgi:nucleotide-binding universal stress UspA family protein